MQPPKAFPSKNKFSNLRSFQKNALGYMDQAIKEQGSPVDLNLPMGDFVLVNDPDQFAKVFADERDFYRKSKGYREIALVLGNGLLTAEGEEWREQRRALQPSFHKSELRKLLPAIWQTGEDYIQSIKTGSTIRLDTEMSGLTMSILLNSLIKYQSDEMISKMSEHIMFGQDFIVNRIRSPFKWPVWIPTKTNRQYHRMMRDANDIIQTCVNDYRVNTHKVEDLLTTLIEFYDPDEGFIEIRNQLLTFLVAGHETSAIAMTWTLHLLAHHPDIQQRLYEEVRGFGNLEDMDVMDYSGLEFTQQVIKESLRYYPPIWNIVRRAIKTHSLGDYDIKPGKQVMLNIYLMHHNHEYWNNPESYSPERFKPDSFKSLHNFQYLPFGGGNRFCIGNNFALYEILLLLVQFVRNFEILPRSAKTVPFNPLLTLRPKDPVEVKLINRKY